ncbi:MAG: hypothetical protein KGQ59_00240, partial [Bdellovibrionales bacterium]|nr:hypothetical protein [Bdellovibrionales bacterium]
VTVLGGTITDTYGNQNDWGAGSGAGLVGTSWFSIIAESSSSVDVTAEHRSGGVLGGGEPQAMIWDSYATGAVNCDAMCGQLAGVMAWSSTGATSYAVGGGQLTGYWGSATDPMTDSYMNPTSANTTQWDPAIWNLPTDGSYPTLK